MGARKTPVISVNGELASSLVSDDDLSTKRESPVKLNGTIVIAIDIKNLHAYYIMEVKLSELRLNF